MAADIFFPVWYDGGRCCVQLIRQREITEMSIARSLVVAAVLTALCSVSAMAGQEQAGAKAKTAAAKTVTTASGLKYTDVKVGSGASPVKGKQVKVHYTGTLENGKKCDSAVGRE